MTIASEVMTAPDDSAAGGPAGRELELEERIGSRADVARGALCHGRHLAIRNDDLREHALRVGRDLIEIEIDQRRAGLDHVADFDARRKPGAIQRHGVDANVHHDLHFIRADRERVARAVEVHHFAGTRRAQSCVSRIDRKAIADQLLREDRIGNPLERPDNAGKRRG